MNEEKIDEIMKEERIKEKIETLAHDNLISEEQASKWIRNYLHYLFNFENLYFGEYETRMAKLWIDDIFLHGGLPSIVFGKQGAGKSHFLSWLIFRTAIFHHNWDIFTNLPLIFFDKNMQDLAFPHIYPMKSMSEMLIQSAQSVLNGREPAVIIDETDQSIFSQRSQTDEALSFKVFIAIERHLRVRGPLLIYHDISDIPKSLRTGGTSNRIIGIVPHDGKRWALGPETKPHKLGIDGFVLPYSSMALMGFAIDVDMSELETRIEAFSSKEVARKILENIDDCLFEKLKENDTASKGLAICPKCDHKMEFEGEGKTIRCENCGEIFRVNPRTKKNFEPGK